MRARKIRKAIRWCFEFKIVYLKRDIEQKGRITRIFWNVSEKHTAEAIAPRYGRAEIMEAQVLKAFSTIIDEKYRPWFRSVGLGNRPPYARPVGQFTYDTTYLPSSDKFHLASRTGGQVDANFSLSYSLFPSPFLFFPIFFFFRFISMDLSGRSTRCQITRALRPTFLIRRHLTPFFSIIITSSYLRSVSFFPLHVSILSNIVYYFIREMFFSLSSSFFL